MTAFVLNDGGRADAGFRRKSVGDCTCRAIAIATPRPYRNEYIASLGWRWVPTMHIGSGCRVHLRANELPGGRLIARLSHHLVGVIHDTHDCSRGGTRCVYGYWERDE